VLLNLDTEMVSLNNPQKERYIMLISDINLNVDFTGLGIFLNWSIPNYISVFNSICCFYLFYGLSYLSFNYIGKLQ
jgi:hypothetical protein